jgi:hypothetical protein
LAGMQLEHILPLALNWSVGDLAAGSHRSSGRLNVSSPFYVRPSIRGVAEGLAQALNVLYTSDTFVILLVDGLLVRQIAYDKTQL